MLHGRPRDDRTGLYGLSFVSRKPTSAQARVDGLGGLRLPINFDVLRPRTGTGSAFHSRDAIPRHRDDALLLHFEGQLGSRLSASSLRRRHPSALGHQLRLHDHPDERGQYVLDGAGDEGGAGMEPELQYLGLLDHGRSLCCIGWAEISRSTTRSCSSSLSGWVRHWSPSWG